MSYCEVYSALKSMEAHLVPFYGTHHLRRPLDYHSMYLTIIASTGVISDMNDGGFAIGCFRTLVVNAASLTWLLLRLEWIHAIIVTPVPL